MSLDDLNTDVQDAYGDLGDGVTVDLDRETRNELAMLLAAFDGDALVMSFTGYWHFTSEQSEALADAIRASDTSVAHHVVDSDYGHDAFLVEPDNVGPPLADFLSVGLSGSAISDTEESQNAASNFAPVHTSLFSQ